jgi:FkbM family methyltransferase
MVDATEHERQGSEVLESLRHRAAARLQDAQFRGAGSLSFLLGLETASARRAFALLHAARILRLPETIRARLAGAVGGPYRSGRLRFHLRWGTLDPLVVHPLHERATRSYLRERLGTRPEGTFVDVGAHCGSFALDFAPLFRHVVAFEPFPDNYAALVRNIELNGAADRIAAVRAAAGNATGSARLFLSKDDTHSLVGADGEAAIDVPVRTVASVLQERHIDPRSVRLIKIDVEGAELDVLKGTLPALEGSPIVVAEANTAAHAEALLEFMRAHGYRRATVTDSRNQVFERAR